MSEEQDAKIKAFNVVYAALETIEAKDRRPVIDAVMVLLEQPKKGPLMRGIENG